MKTIKKAQSGVKQKPKPITGPTFVNLRMARDKSGTGLPATRQDSIDYKKGWQRGLKGDKPSAMEKKYQGENEYEKMGRWEGQNKGKKNAVKKAKDGKSFPDLNKDGKITRADILKGRGVIAKKGATVKKAQNGAPIKKFKTETQAADAGFKKINGVYSKPKATKPAPKPKMKSGGSMKKCKYGCK